MEPEYFQYLLLMLLSIGKARPQNLLLIASLVQEQLVQEVSTQEESGPELENYESKVSQYIKFSW